MNPVQICNNALLAIGCLPIQSFAAPGPSGQIVPATYNNAVAFMLGNYPWRFSLKQTWLSRLTNKPQHQWKYAFRLPPDRLQLPRGYFVEGDDRPYNRLEVIGDTVLTDAEKLLAEYQWNVPPDQWPQAFRATIDLILQSRFALSIKEDLTWAERLRVQAMGNDGDGGQFAAAMSLDAQSNPSPVIDGGRNPITEARYTYPQGDARNGWDW
jgi:hypothetical protein